MSEHDRDLAAMDEGQSRAHHGKHVLMQEAITEVTADAQGRDQADVVDALTRALEARGIGPQPPTWLEAVAGEARQGRVYVEDQSAIDPNS
jgi:hypothetical protein